MSQFFTFYFLTALILIWPFKSVTKRILSDAKNSGDAHYSDAVSLIGEHNTFIFLWFMHSVFWFLTMIGETKRVSNKKAP